MPKPKEEQRLERGVRDIVLAWLITNTTVPQIRAQDYEALVTMLVEFMEARED